MDRQGDAALVRAIRDGEVARFAEVVRRHDRVVRGVVARVVSDPEAREEIVQETFYRAFKSLDSLAEPGKLEGWLSRIARNCATDHHRRRAPFSLDRLAARRAAGEPTWVWEEVDTLSPAHAEVLRLRYRLGHSYRSIARRLKVPLSTVRGRIYEARRALRRRLEELS